MAVSEKLRAFLNQAKVKYTVAKHPAVYTAQEIAASQHVPGRQLAKCVLVKTDRGPLLAVLSAIHRVDLNKLKTLVGAHALTVAKEAEVKQAFPDVDVGAMSPFGNLYNVPVLVDRSVGESQDIVFNAGSHTETMTLRYHDFAALVKPRVGQFAQPFPEAKPKPTRARRAGSKASQPKRPARSRRPVARVRPRRKKPGARKR